LSARLGPSRGPGVLRLSSRKPAGVAEWQTQGTQNPPLFTGVWFRLPPPAPNPGTPLEGSPQANRVSDPPPGRSQSTAPRAGRSGTEKGGGCKTGKNCKQIACF